MFDIRISINPTLQFTGATIKCHQHIDKNIRYPVVIKQYKNGYKADVAQFQNCYKRLISLKIHVVIIVRVRFFVCINCAYIINPFLIDVHQFLVKTIAYTTTPNCLSEIKSLLLLKHLECDMILSVTCRTLVTKHQI